MNKIKRISKLVITGGPSSGKSSVIEVVRAMKLSHVNVIPECARVLLGAGFPIPKSMEQIHFFQKSILSLQSNLEEASTLNQNSNWTHLILDRGKLDGASFWPLGPEDFFSTFNLDPEIIIRSYDMVILLQLPEEKYFGGQDQLRFHNYAESCKSEKVLIKIWSQHPNFIKIAGEKNFDYKLENTLGHIRKFVGL